MIEERVFGTLPGGETVRIFKLQNSHGEYAEILDYGASIHSLLINDRAGVPGDVVQGVARAEDLAGPNREGSVIGRFANRIARGQYEWHGKIVQLETGRGGHFIHGGSGNYARKIFSAETDRDNNRLILSLRDRGEGGFGCEADVRITYSFDDNHCLSLSYDIVPHGDTPVNPTNHAYFNLTGGGDGRDHILTLDASRIALKGPLDMPEGETGSVEGTPLDFRMPRLIRESLSDPEAGETFDECLILDGNLGKAAAELFSPMSGRVMHVYTDMPALQLFLHPGESRHVGKYGESYPPFSSVCLEPEFVPNSVNCPAYDSPLVRKGERFRSRTDYVFSVRSK